MPRGSIFALKAFFYSAVRRVIAAAAAAASVAAASIAASSAGASSREMDARGSPSRVGITAAGLSTPLRGPHPVITAAAEAGLARSPELVRELDAVKQRAAVSTALAGPHTRSVSRATANERRSGVEAGGSDGGSVVEGGGGDGGGDGGGGDGASRKAPLEVEGVGSFVGQSRHDDGDDVDEDDGDDVDEEQGLGGAW